MKLQDQIEEICKDAPENIKTLCHNRDLIKIGRKITKTFYSLNLNDRENCILVALWKCISRYDPEKFSHSSFTSYFYRGLEIECLTWNKGHKRGYHPTHPCKESTKRDDSLEHVDLMDEIEKDENYSILYDRFFLNLSIRQIAVDHNCSYEFIRGKINKSISRIRTNLTECV